ncbi:MAG: hypothetical protein JO286_28205 [Solirubrobacterales bacterium]|nr:hypothetical protein [Solirubrobacterales bacterium]MBV9363434.1 hypothetical protein [Solirubrobacterales bacterium]MBV9811077.1 hypothetical protein [Solirubrobacterales bacterium]
MVEQRPDDRRVMRIAVGGVGGQEHLLLEAEVKPFLSLPMLQERATASAISSGPAWRSRRAITNAW